MRLWWLLVLAGCGRIGFDATTDSGGGGAPRCTEPWSPPVPLGIDEDLNGPSIRGDGLELYASNNFDIVVATRSSRTETFPPTDPLLMPPNGLDFEVEPSISDDGLELFFAVSISGNAVTLQAVRASISDSFAATTTLGNLGAVDISHDRLTMYNGEYMQPIRRFRRPTVGAPFGAGEDLPEVVNAPGATNTAPSISADDLDLYFVRDRMGGAGPEVWIAHRSSPSSEFSTAERLNIPSLSRHPDISEDGHFLYFQGIDFRIWQISRCE